jgi:hypothetical protein
VVTRFQYDDTPHGKVRLVEKQFVDNLTQYNLNQRGGGGQ